MDPLSYLCRFTRHGIGRITLLASLLTAIAVVGTACSSDDDADTTEASAAVAADTLDDRGYADGHRLVSTAWLADHLDDEGVVVIDLRDAEDYAAGHVPGAVNLDPAASFSRVDENGVRGQIGLSDQVAESLGSAGVSPDDTVVFYDGARSLWAARALWVLDVYGHDNARILDGSWSLWAEEEREVSTDAPAVTATEYVFSGEPDEDIIAGYQEIASAISDPEKLVCDARSAEEYTGRDVRSERGGHVPGAVNEDWAQAVNDRAEFRPVADLRGIYEDSVLVSEDDQTVYVYCQTGVRAAHTWFVLHDLLGLPQVENYDGSWEEYGNRSDAEIEQS